MVVHTVTDGAESFTANAYLVTGDRTVLVDAGAYDGVVDEVREHTDDVDAVMLTHQHDDHVGALPEVLEAFDPELYSFGAMPDRSGELFDGDHVQFGDQTFDVVYTPGHADDHVAFVSETALFSGDVVVYNDGAFDDGSFGRTDYPGQSREELIESIEELLDRLPDTVEYMYAGHGDVFEGDVRAVLERALERAERREPKYPDE